MTAALPSGWHQAALGDLVVSLRNGIFARRPNDAQRGVPILRISAVRSGSVDLQDRRFVDGVDDEAQGRFAVQEGDLLVTRYNGSRSLVGVCGRVGPVAETILHPDKLIRLVPDHARVDGQFLALQMHSPAVRSYLEPRIRTTAGQSGISGRDVRSVPLKVPPLDAQHRIVTALEDHLSRLDAGVSYLEACGRRAHQWRQRSRDEQLMLHSSGECRLVDLLARIEAGRSFGGAAPPAGPDEWGVLRVSAMTWGEFRPNENKSVPAAAVNPRWEVRPGDVLVSRANTSEYVGAPVLVPAVRPRLLLSDKSLRLVPAPGVEPGWLVEALASSPVRRQMTALASGTKHSMRNISQANLLSLHLPRPDPQGQRAVMEAAEAARDSATRLSVELQSARKRAASLRRALLTAAFSGQL